MGISKQFKEDIKKAKNAEWIVRCVLAAASLDSVDWDIDENIYSFDDVSDDMAFWHKGDIECTDIFNEKFYVDVKDDKMISRTRNIFAEDTKRFNNTGQLTDGFMRNSNYDDVAICSRSENKIYILDFDEWKKHYKKGRHVKSFLSDAICYGYVMSLDYAKRLGIIKYEIDYLKTFDWWLDDKGKDVLELYEPIKINKCE